MCSVVELIRQHVPEVSVGYVICKRYEGRPDYAKRESKEGD